MLAAALLLVHLVSFAAYLAAGFAQQELMKRSRLATVGAETRNHLEGLCATIVTKIEVPAIMGSIGSGIGFVIQNPVLMKMGWLHGKLLCVVALLVLSHLEMFNARNIVRARTAGKDDEIEARKKKHAFFGLLGTVAAVALRILVTFVRLGS